MGQASTHDLTDSILGGSDSSLHLPNKISLYQVVSTSSLDACELLNSYYGERKPLKITSTG